MKNELLAAAFMTNKDYFISWRTQDNPPYDFAATHRTTGKTRLIDAKTVSFRMVHCQSPLHQIPSPVVDKQECTRLLHVFL